MVLPAIAGRITHALGLAAAVLLALALSGASGDPVAPAGDADPTVGVPPLLPLSDLPPARLEQKIRWRRSKAIGLPYAGRLKRGVQLPAEGNTHFTWDPIRKTSPNRGWRRWGTDRLIRTTMRIARRYARENPGAPRLTIGDLSRPRGGDFERRYGALGHVSHQNGLDVDIFYPRRDGVERPPARPNQIESRLAQELVDRFVAAGAAKVFVGPRTQLHGPPHVVQRLTRHDNHLHVRLPSAGGGSEVPDR